MAQYAYDISELSTGQDPAGFTQRWASLTVEVVDTPEGRVLRIDPGGSDGRYLVSIDEIDSDPDRDDVEIVARWRFSDANGWNFGRLFGRGAGGASGDTTSYHSEHTPGGQDSDKLNLSKYSGGAATTLATVEKVLSANTFYWHKVRIEGTDPTSIKSKIWSGTADDEPSTWDEETTDTDSNVESAGWVGVGRFGGAGYDEYSFIGVGTAGDPAPTSATSTPETRTLSAAVAPVSAATLTPALTPQTRTLSAAVAPASAASLTAAPTPQSRTLSAAIAPASAATLTPARTPQTRSLSPAVAAAHAATLQVTEGIPGPETRTIGAAIAPVSAATLTARPTRQARTLAPAIAPVAAAVLAVRRTAQARSLTPAIAAAHAATLVIVDSSRGVPVRSVSAVRAKYQGISTVRAKYHGTSVARDPIE